MPSKKKQETGPTTAELAEHLERQDAVLEKLDKKLEDAHVLNGGFDNLMKQVAKIDAIESGLGEVKGAVSKLQDCQDAQGKKLDEVHTAVYDPEKGLYSKVKDALKWIRNANWVIKGTLALAGTGGVGGLAKVIYDLVTGHLLVHYTH